MAGKVKTRDRILKTALALFNQEGEHQVSTVDIAAVMGISPGNLYYHFKGKEVIIEALFDDFEEEMRQVLSAPIKRPLDIEDNWVFVYILFEEINDFRFFYYGLASVLERCPNLRPRFSRLLKLKQETVNAILTALEKAGLVAFGPGEQAALATRLAAHLTFWLQYRDLTAPAQSGKNSGRTIINDGVYSTMIQIAPYIAGDREPYAALLAEYFKKQG